MTITDALVLLAAGMAASIMSTVLSLASLVSYPVLLALGLPPLAGERDQYGVAGADRRGLGGWLAPEYGPR